MAEKVDVLVLGSGEAGKYLAWHVAQSGKRAVVIERRWIGGSCPNVNCLPSKNEVHSAKVAHTVAHAADFGVHVEAARVDMARVLARKREMVDGLLAMHLERFRASGAEIARGEGRFVGPRAIQVTASDGAQQVYEGERVVVCVGSRALVPPVPGLAERALTNIELLELDRLPAHLVVMGGGYVGLEFAHAYRRFGSRVTVIERGAELLSHEDPETSAAVRSMLEDEGVELLFNSEVLRVSDGVQELRTPEGERKLDGSHVLVATGRRPNTENIGLELAGVALNERGFVAVNNRLETSASNVWAVGDCAGSPQFTHAAYDDFRVLRDNFSSAQLRSTRGRLIPSCMFTNPPLARVGLSERQAHREGIAVRVATLQVRDILRTRTTSEPRGFMKALVDAHSDRILGFTMLGADAGEVMAVVQTAMLGKLPYPLLRDAILTHPTMAEGLNALFARVPAQVNAE